MRRPAVASPLGAIRAALFVAASVALSACGPSHLALSKEAHGLGIAAEGAGDLPGARGAFERAALEARTSIEAREEARPQQALLVLASARRHLGEPQAAREALARVHREGSLPDDGSTAPFLAAEACALLRDADAAHAEWLCWSHVLDLLDAAAARGKDAGPAMDELRIHAAVELGNMLALRLPSAGILTAYPDPTFQRLLSIARQAPLEPELLVLLARRLAFFCDDAAFTARLAGYREFQVDLLRAARALGWYRTSSARAEALAFEAEIARRPLCPAR